MSPELGAWRLGLGAVGWANALSVPIGVSCEVLSCDTPSCAAPDWFGITNPPEMLDVDGVGRLSLGLGQGLLLGWLARAASARTPGGMDVGGKECRRWF